MPGSRGTGTIGSEGCATAGAARSTPALRLELVYLRHRRVAVEIRCQLGLDDSQARGEPYVPARGRVAGMLLRRGGELDMESLDPGLAPLEGLFSPHRERERFLAERARPGLAGLC